MMIGLHKALYAARVQSNYNTGEKLRVRLRSKPRARKSGTLCHWSVT